ncbi:Thioesterase domain [Dillenia turbinata]|uniref:Acyl-coenzyme A thioesterase 13 n=1 Tax=Dillenia turbinata TaxID=194707 RepID=A0AAN8YWB0_9MAGN
MEESPLEVAVKWLEGIADGRIEGREFEAQSIRGLKILQAQSGFFRLGFVVHDDVLDENGNWHPGAIATLIDDVGASVVFSLGPIKASVELGVSFISTAQINEEVEIEARVVGEKGKIASALVEIRRKATDELIALGKLWMASNIITRKAGLAQAQALSQFQSQASKL